MIESRNQCYRLHLYNFLKKDYVMVVFLESWRQLFKVSEYTFKQNKNMLKNMTVLLYTYFYNIMYIFCNTMSLRVRLGDCFWQLVPPEYRT